MNTEKQKPKKIKNSIIGYISSLALLLTIFLRSMLIHYGGEIDAGYLMYATSRFLIISLIPAIIIYFAKISKWYFSIKF
jgi:hypothetical protein